MSQPERRSFSLHPAIIRSIIREQAGTPAKAICELIMNSVDAGATRIDITSNDGSFCILDDGKGFSSREEIESFFETFGTPHVEGDAKYGRFRIGRGQIMSFARTTWRSGHFEMNVDLGAPRYMTNQEAEKDFLGYELTKHDTAQKGCRIDGKFYDKYHFHRLFTLGAIPEHGEIARMLKYVDVPIFINNVQVNSPPRSIKWDEDDEHAYYQFSRKATNLCIYNQGVLVKEFNLWEFGTGGIIVTKQAIGLNMARNAFMAHCPIWHHIQQKVRQRFATQINSSRIKRLTPEETANLLRRLIDGDLDLSKSDAEKLKDTRFIPDIYGQLRTPTEMFKGRAYTLYDGQHCLVAELVHEDKLACVLMPDFFRGVFYDDEPKDYLYVVVALLRGLGMQQQGVYMADFGVFVERFNDASKTLKDADLDDEERCVLKLIKKLNTDICTLVWGGSKKPRRILCGISEMMDGWTDGSSYISITREQLRLLRQRDVRSGITKVLNLMIHEYCHDDGSLGDHDHDHGFYHRYHEATMSSGYADLILRFIAQYTKLLVSLKIVPPNDIRRFAMAMADHSGGLRYRSGYAEQGVSLGLFERATRLGEKCGALEIVAVDSDKRPILVKRIQPSMTKRTRNYGTLIGSALDDTASPTSVD